MKNQAHYMTTKYILNIPCSSPPQPRADRKHAFSYSTGNTFESGGRVQTRMFVPEDLRSA